RDRRFLQRRAELAQPVAIDETPLLVTSLIFAPDGTVLSALERQRLANAVTAAGREGAWSVAVMGPDELVVSRGAAVTALLEEAGIAPERIAVVAGERQVDLAEVRVRR